MRKPSQYWLQQMRSVTQLLAVAILLAISAPASGQVTDGYTFKQGGVIYRLWGIDAPEVAQTCPDGWPAGRVAATRLQALIAGRSIVCQLKDRDRHGVVVARGSTPCSAPRLDQTVTAFAQLIGRRPPSLPWQ